MKPIDGWEAATEIADWLKGQDRERAHEQIHRQRRDYYRELALESRVVDKSD